MHVLLDRFVDTVTEIPRLVRDGVEYSSADYIDAATEEVYGRHRRPRAKQTCLRFGETEMV